MGRPSKFTEKLFDQICSRLANGEVLKAICTDEQMPDRATVLRWVATDDDKRRKYDAARRACVEFWSDEINQIATDGSNDTIVDRKGRRGCNHEWVSRSRLRIETIWKLMRSISPERYGEKLPEAIKARQIESDEQRALAVDRSIRVIERVIVSPGDGRMENGVWVPNPNGNEHLHAQIAELKAQLAGRSPDAPKPPALLTYDSGPLPARLDKDTLPYGKQRLLEIRYFHKAASPVAGRACRRRSRKRAVVAGLPRDVTVLLIEHDMDVVFSFVDRISVLAGALLVDGAPEQVARDARVKSRVSRRDDDQPVHSHARMGIGQTLGGWGTLGVGCPPWINSEPKSLETGRYRSQRQRLIHHPHALPISAVFGLRYVHTLMRTLGLHRRRTAAGRLK